MAHCLPPLSGCLLCTTGNSYHRTGNSYKYITSALFAEYELRTRSERLTLFFGNHRTLWFHKRQLVVAEEVNAENVTTGDYAVAVRGLGEHEWRREDLATHMAHYGEIVTVCYTKSIGRLLAAETKLHVATTKLDEIKAYRGKVAALSPLPARRKKHTMTHAYHAVAVALFNLSTTGGFGTEKHLATLEVRVKKFQEKCDLETKQKIKNVGDAFVVFNFECHKTRLFEDYRRGWYERTLQWAFPKLKIGAPRFKGKILTMEPPPEPSDVRWGNYGIWRWKRVTKDCATALGMLAAVLVGVVLQGVFTTIKNDLRIDTYDRQLYARATGTVRAFPNSKSGSRFAQGTRLTLFLSQSDTHPGPGGRRAGADVHDFFLPRYCRRERFPDHHR